MKQLLIGTAVFFTLLGHALARDNELLIFAGEAESTINPILTSHQELPSLIFSGLTKYDSEGQIINDLAADISYDAKTLTYTVKLKENVAWHDGEPLTAEDVVFTYEALFDPALISTITSYYLDLKRVSALDELTVSFELSRENAAMLANFTLGILPKHLLEGEDLNLTDFNQEPIGTGRYKFVEWDLGSGRILLERNEDYYDQIPKIEHIVYATVSNESAKSLMLKSGEADLAWLNAKYAHEFRGVPGFVNIDFKSADFRALSPDFKSPFWQKHQALLPLLSLIIDKEALVSAVQAGAGEIAYSPLQLNPLGGNPEANLYTYNPQRFHVEMTKLGYIRGEDGLYEKDGQKLSFNVQVRDFEEERLDLANLVSSMLKEHGVEMQVHLVTRFDFNAGYDAFLSGYAAPYDPDLFYTTMVTGMSENNTAYSNPEVDRLMNEARHTLDPIKRKALYQEFEMAYAKAPSAVLLTYLDGNYVSTDRLSGMDNRRLLGHHAAGVMWNIEDWEIKDREGSD